MKRKKGRVGQDNQEEDQDSVHAENGEDEVENVGIAEVVVLADIPGKNNEVEVVKVVEKLGEGVVRLPKKKWKSRIKESARKKQRGVEEYLRTNLVTCEFHNQLTSTIYCMEEKLGEVCGV